MCKVSTPVQVKFTKGEKKLINTICDDVINSWPPFKDNEAQNNILSLVNGFVFYKAIFQGKLQVAINADANSNREVSLFFVLEYSVGNCDMLIDRICRP